MNFLLAVIIPPDIKDPEKWIEDKLLPYDINTKVEKYKDYLSDDEVNYLMSYHDYGSRIELVLKKNEHKEVFFEDEKGIYQFSEMNRNWKWSNWGIGGSKFDDEVPKIFVKDYWHNHTVKVKDLQDFKFAALLCPQGKWRDCYSYGWAEINNSFNPAKNEEAWEKWLVEVDTTLEGLEDHLILSVVYQS